MKRRRRSSSLDLTSSSSVLRHYLEKHMPFGENLEHGYYFSGHHWCALPFFLNDIGATKHIFPKKSVSIFNFGIELLTPPETLHLEAKKFHKLNDLQRLLYSWESDRCHDLLREGKVPKREIYPANLKGIKLWTAFIREVLTSGPMVLAFNAIIFYGVFVYLPWLLFSRH